MLTDKPIIAVVGAGAVGAYYGGRLAQHGHDVHFLLRSDYETVKRRGWTIRSCDGDFALPHVNAYARPQDMPKADLVLVSIKSTNNHLYEKLIRPVVKDDSTILTLQNGLGNEEQLAALFGAERIVGGIAFVCINRVEPGIVHHMSEGLVRIGEYNTGPSPRLEQIARVCNGSGIRCKIVADLKRARWQKLVWNIPFNGLGAALQMTTGQILASDEGVELAKSLMREVLAAAKGNGVEFDPAVVDQQIEFTKPMGNYKTSMQIDREHGRALEIEAILGQPLRAARAADVATPCLEMLYRMVGLGNMGKA